MTDTFSTPYIKLNLHLKMNNQTCANYKEVPRVLFAHQFSFTIVGSVLSSMIAFEANVDVFLNVGNQLHKREMCNI